MSIDLKRLIQKIIPHDAVNVYVTVWKIYKKNLHMQQNFRVSLTALKQYVNSKWLIKLSMFQYVNQ